MVVKNFSCAVCNSADVISIEPRRKLTYLRCNSCGHCALSDANGDLARSFREAQADYYGELSPLLNLSMNTFESEVVNHRHKVLGTYIHHICDVIEVGPGAGHVIRWLHSKGHNVIAVEHSPVLAKQLADQLSISVMNGEFESIDIPSEICDVFCSFHVIEHVVNPAVHLSKAYALVRPGGLGFIATPNSRSWQQILFESFSPNFDSAHLCVFSKKSLQILCERSGWQIVEIITAEGSAGWARVISKSIRRLKGEDEEQTAGKYAQSSSVAIRIFARVLQIATFPLRILQCRMGYGNEVLLVLKKPIDSGSA